MRTHVALLRGINVGGKNAVPMAALRDIFESAGAADVSTYIQSGNVIFSSSARPAPEVYERAIADRFGVATTVVVRTRAELVKASGANPFPAADVSTLHVGFMLHAPAAAAVKALDVTRFAPEECAVRGRELYLHLPNGVGRSKLAPAVDRQLRVPTTVRNWKTLTKLIELTR